MKTNHYLYSLLFSAVLLVIPLTLKSQELLSIEAGIHTSILPDSGSNSATDVGIGGTFTYNLNRILALDSEFDGYTKNVDAVRSLQLAALLLRSNWS